MALRARRLWGGSYRGVEGLRQWSENVNAIWDAFRLELSELHEADEGSDGHRVPRHRASEGERGSA